MRRVAMAEFGTALISSDKAKKGRAQKRYSNEQISDEKEW